MKKLPSIYKNSNINPINNNKSKCIIKEESKEDILNYLFNELPNPYDIKVTIKTKDKIINDYIVSRTKTNIDTLNNDKINLKDIEYIKKANN